MTEVGEVAQRWLSAVPTHVAEVAEQWDLTLGDQIEHGGVGSIIIAATTRDRTDAVLKLSVPHPEARHEAIALARWQGDGAVSVLRASDDGFTLLLERCRPGTDLWDAGIDEQVEVVVDLLPRIWLAPRPDDPFTELAATAARWEAGMYAKAAAMGVPDDVAGRARQWSARLRADPPRRLLHGDFHPGNVLATQRRPWLVIDPKPWLGDPAFDLAQVLMNWALVEAGETLGAVDQIRLRARQLADGLGLDVDRVLGWAVVKSIGWAFGRDTALVLDAAARAR